MKVVITGYNTCCLNKSGGIKVRVQKIYELLTKREDVEVEYFCPMTTDLQSCDVLHLFKLESEYYSLVIRAKSLGIKIVLSSVVNLVGGSKIDFYHRFINKLPILTSYKMVETILKSVDVIITESNVEADFISKHYGVCKKKFKLIGNGIDMPSSGGDEIFEHIGGKKDYVLQVGRIDPNKNVLNVIKALKDTGIEYVIIGGADVMNQSYYDRCQKEAKNNTHIHFLGWVDNKSPLLASAYSNARVIALSSHQETFGLVAVEGAAYGCNVAMTKNLPIHDYRVFDDCWLFDPNCIDDIREKIIDALEAPKSDKTKMKVLKTFSWSRIIDEHIELYNSLTNE